MSNISRGEEKGVSGTPFFKPSHRGFALAFVIATLTFLLSVNFLSVGSGAEAAVNLTSHASTTISAIVVGSPTVGNTTTIDIVADDLPDGLSGFEINVALADTAIADITAVQYHTDLSPTIAPSLPADSVDLFAADVDEQIQAGASGVTLATLTVQGTAKGTTSVDITIGTTFGVQDETGTTVLSATVSGSLVVDNSAPSVNAGGDQPSVTEGDLVSLDPATFTDADSGDSHTASIDWGDGSPLDTPTPSGGNVSGSHTYVDNGSYTVTVTVDDGTDSGSDTLLVTVANADPVVTANTLTSVPEGPTGTLALATYTDAGSSDTHTADINWGDGNTDLGVAVSGGTVSAGHSYDDEGTGTYTITITVSDGTDSDLDTTSLTVTNAAPIVSAGIDQIVTEGDTVNLAPATFTDAGTADTHTAEVDWDDGAGFVSETVVQGSGSGDVTGSHVYPDNGTFTVTVRVTDIDGGVHTDSLVVTVNNANPVVTASADIIVNVGVTLSAVQVAAYIDAGTSDTHTATIDWDDGIVDNIGSVSGTVSGTHSYATSTAYTITVTVTDNDGGVGSDTLVIDVQDFPALPGSFGKAQDLNGDGTAEDVNGNGGVDFNDVVLLFQNLLDPSVQNNQLDFDFNFNGRIDFDDVVQLFISFQP